MDDQDRQVSQSSRYYRMLTRLNGIRTFFGILSVILAAASVTLLVQTVRLYRIQGDFPTILAGFTSIIFLTTLLVTTAFILAQRILPFLLVAFHWLIQTRLIILLLIGLFSYDLLVYQTETWVLDGQHVASGILCAAILIACIYFVLLAASTRGNQERAIHRNLAQPHPWFQPGKLTIHSLPTYLLGMIVLVHAVMVTLFAIKYPLLCDEATTLWLFAKSAIAALIRYDAPNNHILNSLMVWASTGVFGVGEFSVRLFPCMLSIAGIISTYMLAKKLFNPYVAAFSAAIGASSLWFLFYAFQARGYIYEYFLAPVAVLGFLSTLDQPSRRPGWILFVAASGLAIATVPTAIYFWFSLFVFGAILFAFHRKLGIQLPSKWVPQSLLAFGAVLFIAGVVYINPLFSMFKAGKLSSINLASWSMPPISFRELIDQFLVYSFFAGSEISAPVFHGVSYIVLISALFGLVWLVIRKTTLIFVLFASLLFSPMVLLVWQKTQPQPRHFFYLLSFISILCGLGFYAVISFLNEILSKRLENPGNRGFSAVFYPLTALVLYLVLVVDRIPLLTQDLVYYHTQTWPAKLMAQFLEENAEPTDGIVAGMCIEYMVAYQIQPAYHITDVLEWWSTGTPNTRRVFLLPGYSAADALKKSALNDFLQRTCEGFTDPVIVASMGSKNIYLCEQR